MKAVIPLAGRGTRLRPHTHRTPKPLVHVAGRPVMAFILDDLIELGVDEIVFIVGYLQERIREFIEEEYPDLRAHYVEQEIQNGTAGAVQLAEPYVDGEVLILFVDTLFDADLSMVRNLPDEWAGVIWVKEVEDYQRFGVVLTDDDGAMTRIVEKPKEPISKLANIGLYFIRDHELLFEGVRHALDKKPGPGGEFYLTDAFQYMVDQGARIRTAPVEGWYDCGKPETLLETNAHLLATARGTLDDRAGVEESELHDPVRLEADVSVLESTIGPNVTLERGARVVRSTLRDCIVGAGASIEDAELHDSIVGEEATVRRVRGRVNVMDHSEVEGD